MVQAKRRRGKMIILKIEEFIYLSHINSALSRTIFSLLFLFRLREVRLIIFLLFIITQIFHRNESRPASILLSLLFSFLISRNSIHIIVHTPIPCYRSSPSRLAAIAAQPALIQRSLCIHFAYSPPLSPLITLVFPLFFLKCKFHCFIKIYLNIFLISFCLLFRDLHIS